MLSTLTIRSMQLAALNGSVTIMSNREVNHGFTRQAVVRGRIFQANTLTYLYTCMNQLGGAGNTFFDIIPPDGVSYTSLETTDYLQCAGVHVVSATEVYFLVMTNAGTWLRLWLDYSNIGTVPTWGQGIGYETFDGERSDIYAAIDDSNRWSLNWYVAHTTNRLLQITKGYKIGFI